MSFLTDRLSQLIPGASLLRAIAFSSEQRLLLYIEGARSADIAACADDLKEVTGLDVTVKDVSDWKEIDFLRESLSHLNLSVSIEEKDGVLHFDDSQENWEKLVEEYRCWDRGDVSCSPFQEPEHVSPSEETPFHESQIEEMAAEPLPEELPPQDLFVEAELLDSPQDLLNTTTDSPEEIDVAERIRREMQELVAVHQNTPQRKERKRSASKHIGDVAARTATIAEALEQGPQKGLIVQGELISLSSRRTKNDRILYNGAIYDGSGSLPFTIFASPGEQKTLNEFLQAGKYYRVRGQLSYSEYDGCMVIQPQKWQEVDAPVIPGDDSEIKRVELSALTNMSEVDGVVDADALLERAVHYGMEAIAITDHMNLLSYPRLSALVEKLPIKVIYGMQGVLYDDETLPFTLPDDVAFDGTFVAVDLETTGLRPDRDEIIEIGAARIHNFEVVDTFSSLVRPNQPIPAFTTELTGITQGMVDHAPSLEESLQKLVEFVADAPIAAHNSNFDSAFLRAAFKRTGMACDFQAVDTLALSYLAHPELRTHNLKRMARVLKIKQTQHHRALDDAMVCGKILSTILMRYQQEGITTFRQLNEKVDDAFYLASSRKYSFTLLAAKEGSLPILYELLSDANLHHIDHRGPAIPRSRLKNLGDNFLLGSGDGAGELFEAIYNAEDPEKLRERALLYDFLEIQPPVQHHTLLERQRVSGTDDIIEIQMKIKELADELQIPLVATTHSRYLDPPDFLYRNIVREGQNRGYTLETKPGYTFLRTNEMLQAFSFLGKDKAREIVIDNTVKIAQSIPQLYPLKKGKYPPTIDHSDELLRNICFDKAASLYGTPLPEPVSERLEEELQGIIGNGYAVLYIAAQKLVLRSEEMGYIVGSRGSVGSSFAATMAGITEVNPLAAHYACASCAHFEFNEDPEVENGFDMPEKKCPHCDKTMYQDGFNIPFESFIGFDGNKEPDIDLNFAPVIQLQIQAYTGELFGEDLVFKGGTISAVKDRTAYGYTKSYFENRGRELPEPEINRISSRLEGIRRSTGQHPAGIITIPRGVSIYEFTPIQYPAHNADSGVITTHFDYDALKGRLMKLDILGHDVPTLLHDLEALSGFSPHDISLRDQEVLRLFNGVDVLQLKDTRWSLGKGTLGVPEFGTTFTRGILSEVHIGGIEDLVRVSGLSHGSNVWAGNAQELVREGTVDFKHVIATREQIMIYCQQKGLSRSTSFDIMGKVKGGARLTQEEITAMQEAGIDQWYIDSCNKMGYMFPKAHAVAYVLNGFRIAWYKLHAPAAFYAAYFSTKVDTFDVERMCRGLDAALDELKAPREESRGKDKESETLALMEVVYEMYARGLDFATPKLYDSHPQKFLLEDGKILPPLRAIAGVGENAALGIAEAREDGAFLSIEDLSARAKLNKTAVEALRNLGVLQGLSETNQLDLFSFL